jgi:hypothetical protein
MKFYPLHILIKDLSFFIIFTLLTDQLGTTDFDNLFWIILFALTMTRGTILINLIIQTIMYFGLKHYLRFKTIASKFAFGLGLHLVTVLFWLRALWTTDKSNAIVALLLSGIISGLSYLMLNNKTLDNFVKKLRPLTKSRSAASSQQQL